MDANALADAVANHSGLSRPEVDRVLCSLQSVVLETLRRNEDVAVANFGIWHRPIRSDDTEAFEFVVPVGPLAIDPPDLFKVPSPLDPKVAGVAQFLLENPVMDETFGIGRDPFPDLPESIHPGIITADELEKHVTASACPAFSPQRIGRRVIQNLGGVVTGSAVCA